MASAASTFTNDPFTIDDYIKATDKTCPAPGVFAANGVLKDSPGAVPGGCTRDIVHRFYQEQYQLNGGKQNRYVTGSDAVGLTMGTYDTKNLPIYQLPHTAGTHRITSSPTTSSRQRSVDPSSTTSTWWRLGPRSTPRPDRAARTQGCTPWSIPPGFPNSTYPLYHVDPAVTVNDAQLTQACDLPTTNNNVACGDYAVNTMQPANPPSAGGTAVLPLIDDADLSQYRRPAQLRKRQLELVLGWVERRRRRNTPDRCSNITISR